MLINIIIFLCSIIPSGLIVVWLMNRRKEDLAYRKSCKSAFTRGFVVVLPILVTSLVFNILAAIVRKTFLGESNVLLYQGIYKFIVLALAEELVKFLAFKGLLEKKYNAYSWADVTAFMVIIGTMFGLVEDVPYAIGSNPIEMLVRGITMGHVGYAFIMGWFYGKKLYTGKKHYGIIAFVVPFLIHGLYDFSLTPELLEYNDNFAFAAVSIAALDIVLIALMIRFFIRCRNKEFYNEPLITE